MLFSAVKNERTENLTVKRRADAELQQKHSREQIDNFSTEKG